MLQRPLDKMPVYRLRDFEFELPPELIAQVPVEPRSSSRLLHVEGQRREDRAFADLPGLLRAGDLLVFNDTRVIKARVFADKKTGGKVELLVERIVAERRGVGATAGEPFLETRRRVAASGRRARARAGP